MQLDKACIDILSFDEQIRYVGFADSLGRMVSERSRSGVKPHLSKDESGLSIMQATLRISMRKVFEAKLGNVVYSYSLYERVKRVSIPLFSGQERIDRIISPFALLLSIEVECSHERLILKKIIPYLEKSGLKTNDRASELAA